MTHSRDDDRSAHPQANEESARPEAAHDEDESAVDLHLSTEFVEAVGPEKIQRLIELVERLGAGREYSAPAMREAFAAGLADIDVQMNEVEQERYVERLCAGTIVHVQLPGHVR